MSFKKNRWYVFPTFIAFCLFVLNDCALMEGHKIPEVKEVKTEAELGASLDEGVKEAISGKWKRGESGDMIEFLRDGTVKFYSPIENAVYPGTYRVDDDKHITTQLEQGGSITWGFVVSKSELQLTAPSGLVLKYRKTP
ncbi:MAG: hypothetical protein NTV99_02145 [Deltaproteobacteria bacterium]|nr:hypothetical protein [Deltaproteobacteria bacterium]